MLTGTLLSMHPLHRSLPASGTRRGRSCRPAWRLLAALALASACGAAPDAPAPGDDAGLEEHAPEALAQHSDALVGYDCSTHQDTGYTNGNPFSITLVTVDGNPVEIGTANAFLTMAQAANGAGIELRINSGFRTMAEQQYLYNCYLTKKCNSGNLAAKPGYSNHQSGLALDLTTSSWLAKNASKYGFIRTVPSEDWHYEYTGGSKDPGGPCSADSESTAPRTLSWLAPKADASVDRNNVVLQVKVTDPKVVAVKYYQGTFNFATATRADGFAATYDFKYTGDKTLTAVGVNAAGDEIDGAAGNVDVTVE